MSWDIPVTRGIIYAFTDQSKLLSTLILYTMLTLPPLLLYISSPAVGELPCPVLITELSSLHCTMILAPVIKYNVLYYGEELENPFLKSFNNFLATPRQN